MKIRVMRLVDQTDLAESVRSFDCDGRFSITNGLDFDTPHFCLKVFTLCDC